jgi:anthranilate synthase component 1
VPVYREIIADMETPVSAFQKIDTGAHSFLFESVEKGGKFARYSFLGASPVPDLSSRAARTSSLREGQRRARLHDRGRLPLRELETPDARLPSGDRRTNLPLFFGGAVGYLGFEAVTQFEPSVPRARRRTTSACPTPISSSPTRC